MADPSLMDVLRAERTVLRQAINAASADLQAATIAHDQALAAYEAWKTRIINAASTIGATVPNDG